jgi:hypothetical protein
MKCEICKKEIKKGEDYRDGGDMKFCLSCFEKIDFSKTEILTIRNRA